MLLDRKKYTESAYIAEELLGDYENDRLRKCAVVQQTIADGDFSFDEALEAYGVDKKEYESYVAKNSNSHIFLSFSGASESIGNYFDVVTMMLGDRSINNKFDENISKRLVKLTKELESISKALKQH
ncbi:hypothetical protein [Mucilaginibacter sp.]|uniref:hypothetical protein n=1 Tax=Mucilaginibacter sp. TaxID=1882438 RepID=UPI0032677800